MKTVKQLGSLIFLLFLAASLISCDRWEENRAEENNAEDQDIFFQESTEGISWSLTLPSGPFSYTDRIPVLFSLEIAENSPVPVRAAWRELSPEPSNTVWGDFRVRRMARSGASYRIELIPRHTGECHISIPLYKSAVSGSTASPGDQQPLIILEPDLILQVVSQLDEKESDPEPAGLIPDIKTRPYGLWIGLSIAAFAAAGLVIFLIIRKRRLGSGKESPALPSLESLLEENPSLTGHEDVVALYRIIFRLLVEDLAGLHPGVKGKGFGPAELMAALEQPSALNQIFLRSLYPLLGRMEDIFFTPDSYIPDEREYQEHRNLLKDWLTFMKEEHGEV